MSIDNELSRNPSTLDSVGLSETATLNYTTKRNELQDTYDANFTLYYPFVLRKQRLAAEQEAVSSVADSVRHQPQTFASAKYESESYKDDDASTIFTDNLGHSSTIFGKSTSVFDSKRELILVKEFMHSSYYLFPSENAFEIFKQCKNKNPADSKIVSTDDAPDPQQFGIGLPLLKIQVPYLSQFRTKAPYMVFKKYREKSLCSVQSNISTESGDSLTSLADHTVESYKYCAVYNKNFTKARRFIFEFYNDKGDVNCKVILFMNNFKPFADFVYKGTRFRILGTSIITAFHLDVAPSFKLLIVDDNKPSLCDNIVDKKPGFVSNILKRQRASSVSDDVQDDFEANHYKNPYPNPDNKLYEDDLNNTTEKKLRTNHISDNLPPFGTLRDVSMYGQKDSHLIPKKYTEAGKIQLYQDSSHGSLDSVFSIDEDTSVISCILITLREVSLRNASKAPQRASLRGLNPMMDSNIMAM